MPSLYRYKELVEDIYYINHPNKCSINKFCKYIGIIFCMFILICIGIFVGILLSLNINVNKDNSYVNNTNTSIDSQTTYFQTTTSVQITTGIQSNNSPNIIKIIIFDKPGEYILNPEDYMYNKNIIIEMWGAGAGGFSNDYHHGYGGGSGSYLKVNMITNNLPINLIVGKGGYSSNTKINGNYVHSFNGSSTIVYGKDINLICDGGKNHNIQGFGQNTNGGNVLSHKMPHGSTIIKSINGQKGNGIDCNDYHQFNPNNCQPCGINNNGNGGNAPFGGYGGMGGKSPFLYDDRFDGQCGGGGGGTYIQEKCVQSNCQKIRAGSGGNGSIIIYYYKLCWCQGSGLMMVVSLLKNTYLVYQRKNENNFKLELG